MRIDVLELTSPIDMEYPELVSKIIMEMEGVSKLDKTKELTTKINKELNSVSTLRFEDFLEEV